MSNLSRMLSVIFVASVIAAGAVGAADQPSASEKDPLRATLLESKEKARGVTIHANGTSIPLVVVSLDDKYVRAGRVIEKLAPKLAKARQRAV